MFRFTKYSWLAILQKGSATVDRMTS